MDVGQTTAPLVVRRPAFAQQAHPDKKHSWKEEARHGFKAAWKFVRSPSGFLTTLYGLNIVAWGAMLFFLLLGAAPAMNHPSKKAVNSRRKIWLEIDSQVMNALFCATGFGLAPWRFMDLYWLMKAGFTKDAYPMGRLCEQNKSWFRPPAWYTEAEQSSSDEKVTSTGQIAPPTSFWKLGFCVWMLVLNSLFQAALASLMWTYNRINRPIWGAGLFIGLGCSVGVMAGVMMWWEGRKVKKIEGPAIKARDVDESDKDTSGQSAGRNDSAVQIV